MEENEHFEAALTDPDFQEVLVSCLERIERGENLDLEALLKAYPEHAETLHAFLEDRAALRGAAEEFRDSIAKGRAKREEGQLDKAIDSGPLGGPISMPGKRVRYFGDYEIIKEIARGGMGVVFKARQQKLDRMVALKMLLSGHPPSGIDVERFQVEARAAGRLKHPNIVPIHEIGEHEGHHFFTMDYVEGESLSEAIRERTVEPYRAARVVCAAADAVQFAHDQGVLHRDLKPANVLIDADGQPHVTDFGLAKIREPTDGRSPSELTTTGQILGTPSYMSPEQAAGKTDRINQASDVYGLGAILYASLTGRAPFVAESPVETIRKVLHEAPLSPRNLDPSVPRDLEQICLKCLHKNPKDRYASVSDLASDLRRFIAGEPVEARPLPALTRLFRWSDRNIGKFSAIAIVVVLSLPMFMFVGMGLALQRWPWQLLLISYTLTLVLSVPYILMMLITSTHARTKRRSGELETHNRQGKSMPLLWIGGVLLTVAIGGYGWMLLKHGWGVPEDSRYLVIVAILGIGAIIRGIPGRG